MSFVRLLPTGHVLAQGADYLQVFPLFAEDELELVILVGEVEAKLGKCCHEPNVDGLGLHGISDLLGRDGGAGQGPVGTVVCGDMWVSNPSADIV